MSSLTHQNCIVQFTYTALDWSKHDSAKLARQHNDMLHTRFLESLQRKDKARLHRIHHTRSLHKKVQKMREMRRSYLRKRYDKEKTAKERKKREKLDN